MLDAKTRQGISQNRFGMYKAELTSMATRILRPMFAIGTLRKKLKTYQGLIW
jgi:hypothetical protein